MPLIEWNNELQLGRELIDDHHRHLVELLNRAHDAFIWGMEPGQIAQTVKQLKEYADYHFTAEEKLMLELHDPFLTDHRKEHEAFRTKVAEIGSIHTKDCFPAYLAIIDFLLEWLVTHIKTTDRTSLACRDQA